MIVEIEKGMNKKKERERNKNRETERNEWMQKKGMSK